MTIEAAEPLLWGGVGGVLGNLLVLLRHAKLPKVERPDLLSDPWFWSGWVIEALFGVILSLAYLRTGVHLPPLVAINIGASAPLIIEKLLSTLPAIGRTA